MTPTDPAGPLVSVVMISYNQDQFIGQALDSVLEQEADFPVEVIVADDASPDRTAEIVEHYARAHPEWMRPVLRATNVGIHANLVDALQRSKGRYVALCEGDDYWTDKHKLQRQVEFMEQHPATSVCFHPVRVAWAEGSHPDEQFPPADWVPDVSLVNLLQANFIQTNSVLYRRLPRYDDVPDVMPLDWYLHIRHALTGQIQMLPDCMAVYRRHPGGVWYDSAFHHAKFWTAHGAGHAALYESLLDLVGDDPDRQEAISELAARVMVELTRIEGETTDRSALLEALTAHPRWAEAGVRGVAAKADELSLELAAARGTIEEASNRYELEVSKTQELRSRVQKQRARIQRLRRKLDISTAELEATRRRLPRARARALLGRVAFGNRPSAR